MLNQINFLPYFAFKNRKNTSIFFFRESYQKKKKKIKIKHSNILKNKALNFILIHIN
jgi:hypothetical protein